MSSVKVTNIAHPSSASNNIVLDSSGNATLATAKITTLADSAGSNTSTPAEIASGRAKAWVNFNGTGSVAIRASYNVSSITDNGTGDYTMNFTTALPDTNYAVIQGAANDGGNDGNRIARWQTFSQNTGSFRFQIGVITTTFTASDASNIHAAIFR